MNTQQNIMEETNYIKQLSESTMFHMSLGSKELFHSNFLHWISLVNWSAFLEIMHGLADTEKFWWEKVDEKDPRKCPEDIKVFREHRKFDLSIYILDSEKEVDDNSDKKEDDGPITEITHDSKVQKWIPVLVLENKMKSLPYKAQLEEYTQKAFEEWRKGEKVIKPRIEEIKRKAENTKEEVNSDWNSLYGITFILLSLMHTTIGNGGENYKICQPLKYQKNKNKKYSLSFCFEWKHKTYKDFLSILKGIKDEPSFSDNKLDKSVIKDYYNFVKAFWNLSSTWIIDCDKAYCYQISPRSKEDAIKKANQIKISEIEAYEKLRIHDIHEKILYDQLLNELENQLTAKKVPFKRYNAKTVNDDFNNDDSDKKVKIFTKSDYSHGIGVFEVQYFLFPFVGSNKSDKGKEQFFKIMIQVQGDRYCHMVICNDIVEEKESENSGKKKTLNVNQVALNNSQEIGNEKIKDLEKKIDGFIIVQNNNKVRRFPEQFRGISEPEDYHKYGKNNIYQYVVIPQKAKIKDVIGAIIEDILKIDNWFKND